MPTFQVRNRRTKMILGEVTVSDPERVLDQLKEATGSSVEEIAQSLGTSAEEAKACLDIVELQAPAPSRKSNKRAREALSPRQLFRYA